MLVTLSGIIMLVKPVQPENAPSSILVTLFGIVISVKAEVLLSYEYCEKAPLLILCIPFGNVIFPLALEPSIKIPFMTTIGDMLCLL